MIRIDDTHAIRVIAQVAHVQYVPAIHHCIAQYTPDDILMGGILFTDWNGGSLQVHMALFGGGGSFRPMIWLGFQYPFVQLKIKKMFGLVPEYNERARKFNLHLGFKIEYLADDVFNHPPGVPNGMYLMSMRKEDCRWLDMKPPVIEYAPTMFTNNILQHLPTVGMMQ